MRFGPSEVLTKPSSVVVWASCVGGVSFCFIWSYSACSFPILSLENAISCINISMTWLHFSFVWTNLSVSIFLWTWLTKSFWGMSSVCNCWFLFSKHWTSLVNFWFFSKISWIFWFHSWNFSFFFCFSRCCNKYEIWIWTNYQFHDMQCMNLTTAKWRDHFWNHCWVVRRFNEKSQVPWGVLYYSKGKKRTNSDTTDWIVWCSK